jgi:hypothetical protein
MSTITKFRILWGIIWALSAFALATGLVFLQEPNLSNLQKNLASISVQLGGAFFFALTAGYIVEKIRSSEGYSVLWLFSQEFRKAGVSQFYSDRKGQSEKALEEAFNSHFEGEVLMAGASLRLFLATGQHFHDWTSKILSRKNVRVRAVFCSPEGNDELPLRSFIEEFNQDKNFPKDSPFDWSKKINFSFEEFKQDFYRDPKNELRVINDLMATRRGITALKGLTKSIGSSIDHREIRSAPYCTVIIFPDKAFYTPNLLSEKSPVNMPTLVFHKTSEVYKRLKEYIEFLWWVNPSQPSIGKKND